MLRKLEQRVLNVGIKHEHFVKFYFIRCVAPPLIGGLIGVTFETYVPPLIGVAIGMSNHLHTLDVKEKLDRLEEDLAGWTQEIEVAKKKYE